MIDNIWLCTTRCEERGLYIFYVNVLELRKIIEANYVNVLKLKKK